MARESFVMRGGRLIPKHLASPREKHRGVEIIKDIEPFLNIAIDNKVISGRRARRDMMRAHGLVEVGNEPIKPEHLRKAGDRLDPRKHQESIAEATSKAWYKLTGEY